MIFDLVPIGSIVAWSDGTACPPEFHIRKLSAWWNNNSCDRLVQKQDARRLGSVRYPRRLHRA